MAFEPQPIIIEFFPLLVTIPAIVAFLAMVEMRRRSIQPDSKPLRLTRKHIIRTIQLAVFVPFIGISGTIVLALVLNVETASYWLTIFLFVLHTVISILLGVAAGILLAMAYGYHGVSAFTVAACMMCVPSIIVLRLGVSGPAVSFALDRLDSLAPFMVLFWSGCFLWPLKKMLGKFEPTDQAKSEALRQLVSSYVLEVIHILQRRGSFCDDPLAEKTLERFLQTTGPTGDFIRACKERGGNRSSTESVRHRYSPPAELKRFVPAGNWTLTTPQFGREVLVNRLVFSASAIVLTMLCLYFVSNLSEFANQWSLVLFLGVLVPSVPLALSDSVLRGTRDDVEKAINLLLAPLKGIDEALKAQGLPQVASWATTGAEVAGEEPTAVTALSPDFIKQQKPSLHFFLNRVVKGKNEVYEESVRPLGPGIVGVVAVATNMAVLVITWFHHQPLFLAVLMLFAWVVVPFLVAVIVWWHLMIKRTSFRGYRRSWFSLALSYLDAKESGNPDFGPFISIPSPPGQFVFLAWGGVNALRGLLRKLRSATGLKVPTSIERKSLEFEMQMAKPVMTILLMVLAVFCIGLLLSPRDSLFFLPFVLLMSVLFPVMLCLYVRNTRKLRRMQSETPTESDTGPVETVAEVLQLLRSEYSYPLRLLVVREHPELLYTGKTYLTTGGVRFREAIFLPSTPR